MNLGLAALILVFVVLIIVRYSLIRKTRRTLWRRHSEVLQEQETFLKTFSVIPFDDFSAFDFRLGRFSHISPFPKLTEDKWRYTIYLSSSEAEDITTITHEITECTLGRIIEKLLNLKTPLYLQRKEDDKFWVHGKKQRYLVEHVMATFGEIEDLTPKKLRERLNREEAETWLNLRT